MATVEIKCNFCGKKQNAVKKLIASPKGDAYICKDCVEICGGMIKEEKVAKKYENVELTPPMDIKAKLDDYIIGQENAKKVLSVAVYNHYKRINHNNSISINEQNKSSKKEQIANLLDADWDEGWDANSLLTEAEKKNLFSMPKPDSKNKKEKVVEEEIEIELEKSNILMIGPTGSGKTLLAKTLAKVLNVPFASCDATALTEAGYVGDDVENVLLKLIQNADGDISRAERGIIYIDEVDKIAKKGENKSITRDVSGEGVQQGLLKIIEGTIAGVPPQGGRKHPQQELLYINTQNILFICGGAFVGLDKIINERTTKSALGFNAEIKQEKDKSISESLKKITPSDLQKFGLIPEFVGRLPVVVSLHDLDENALISILTQPKNAITKQYTKMFKLDNIDLNFTEAAVRAVAKKAIELKTGARGLRTILENKLIDIMYDSPGNNKIAKIEIDENFITDDIGVPKITNKSKTSSKEKEETESAESKKITKKESAKKVETEEQQPEKKKQVG